MATQYIKNGEKNIALKLSFKALNKFEKLTGKNFINLSEDLSLDDFLHLFYVSHEAGVKADGEKFELSLEDCEEILDKDDFYQKFVEKLPNLIDKKK